MSDESDCGGDLGRIPTFRRLELTLIGVSKLSRWTVVVEGILSFGYVHFCLV